MHRVYPHQTNRTRGQEPQKPTPVAAIYTRISLDLGFDELAVERQETECRRRAGQDGIEIPPDRVYVDISKSAYKKVKRPAYERLLADVYAGEVNRVYVWDLDRLTRQPVQMNEWIELADAGACFVVEAHGLELDLTKPGQILIARIRTDVAENESRHKGERHAAAARQRAEKGYVRPCGKRTFGYVKEGGTPSSPRPSACA